MEKHLIFISYASQDYAVAQLICHRLEEDGVRCWIAPRDILHGDWAGEIMAALDRADVCIVVVGEHSAHSPEVLADGEIPTSRYRPIHQTTLLQWIWPTPASQPRGSC